MNRRIFARLFLGGSVTAFVAAVIYPVLRFLTPPQVAEAKPDAVVAARRGELKPNSSKLFAFGRQPGLLVMTDTGDYRAFLAKCTHLDCTVQYRPDLKHIWCACHNGHYDLSGNVISGPPPKPLTPYRVVIKGDDIIVSRET